MFYIQFILLYYVFWVYYLKKIKEYKKMFKTNVIIHIFNEEYLLPFWLIHHKKIFDYGVIIDYRSTDNSLKICKEICPDWEIITSRNSCFEAIEIDKEVMDIESRLEGIKLALNVTEFIFLEKPLSDYFEEYQEKTIFKVRVISPYSNLTYYPINKDELISGLLNTEIKFHYDRSQRFIHNFSNGDYTTGRHFTNHKNEVDKTSEIFIVWFGFYPWNEHILNRKLQIKQNIPISDRLKGFSTTHFWDKEQMIHEMKTKFESGIILSIINNRLYEFLKKIIHYVN
jgi:hypothetical protein